MTDEMLAELPDFRNSLLFTPREKAALELADTMARDHHKVDDALFARLREHFSEREIMAVGWRAGIFIGYGRLVYAVDLESVGDVCPLTAQASGG